MENDFLTSSIFVYIERESVGAIDPEFIIDRLDPFENRRIQLN